MTEPDPTIIPQLYGEALVQWLRANGWHLVKITAALPVNEVVTEHGYQWWVSGDDETGYAWRRVLP